MISAPTYTIKGEETEKTALPKSIFEIKASPTLLAWAVRAYMSNQRKARAKTKTRGRVAKTTAKMYRQKGTGRARHGSYSAPMFVGGGVSHGPTGGENWKLKTPRLMARKALLAALSVRAREKQMWIVTGSDKADGKTKTMSDLLNKMGTPGKKLFVVANAQSKLKQGLRNLEGVTVANPENLNTYLILANKTLITTREAVEEIKKIYAG